MKIEIYVCDICKKEVPGNLHAGFDRYWLDVCVDCYEKVCRANDELDELNNKYNKDKKDIIEKYELSKLYLQESEE